MFAPLRYLHFAFLILAATQVPAIETGTQKDPQTAALQPGDYEWQPSASPDGPVVIVVDLNQQLLQVFRNGVQIGRSTVSSGVANYGTPAGIFTIVQKNISHHSNLYHEASMPYMERLTWAGLAIHAGNVPGHPDSHGCVHVPMAFAKKLYEITSKGAAVLITQGENSPGLIQKPDLEFASGKVNAPETSPQTPFVWRPQDAPAGPLCVVVSTADQQIHVYRKGVEIGRAMIGGAGAPSTNGNRVYAAATQTGPDGAPQWNALGSVDSSPAPNAADVLRQLNLPPDFWGDLQKTITPGTTLVVTDEAVDRLKSQGADIPDAPGQ